MKGGHTAESMNAINFHLILLPACLLTLLVLLLPLPSIHFPSSAAEDGEHEVVASRVGPDGPLLVIHH